MNIIGITGLARSGKDTFCLVSKDILSSIGVTARQYSFANSLKNDVKSFLLDKCGVDVNTNDTKIKTEIRDFLVWYGTTFWRARNPNKWIEELEKQVLSENSNDDIVIVSDIRYKNEADWIHQNGGVLVHVSSFINKVIGINFIDDKCTKYLDRVFDEAPNEQERINDPLLKSIADIKVEWEKLNYNNHADAIKDIYLRNIVYNFLSSCRITQNHFIKSVSKNV